MTNFNDPKVVYLGSFEMQQQQTHSESTFNVGWIEVHLYTLFPHVHHIYIYIYIYSKGKTIKKVNQKEKKTLRWICLNGDKFDKHISPRM